jgi:hypothetical protein
VCSDVPNYIIVYQHTEKLGHVGLFSQKYHTVLEWDSFFKICTLVSSRLQGCHTETHVAYTESNSIISIGHHHLHLNFALSI